MIKKTYALNISSGELSAENKRDILLAAGYFARSTDRSFSPLLEIDLPSNDSKSDEVSVSMFSESEERLYFGAILVGKITQRCDSDYPSLTLNDVAYQIFNRENEYWERALSPTPRQPVFFADNTELDANYDEHEMQFPLDEDEKEDLDRTQGSMLSMA